MKSAKRSCKMKQWYALKVFYNRFSAIVSTLNRDGVESYVPKTRVEVTKADGQVIERERPLSAMLMFLCCDEEYIARMNKVLYEKAMVYHYPGTNEPAPIPEEEMQDFITVTTAIEQGLELTHHEVTSNDRRTKYLVTDGQYKGVRGYLKRIKGEKRLVIPVADLLTLATTSYIPNAFLSPITAPLA